MHIISQWMNNPDNSSIYRGFKTEKETQKAKQTIVLARTSKRSKEESLKLYKNIDWLVRLAKDRSKAARTTLTYLFFPLIFKSATKHYHKYCTEHQERIHLDDVVQFGFEKLLELIGTHISAIAPFPYYASKLLDQHIRSYITRELQHTQKAPITITGNNTKDLTYGKKDSMFDQFMGEELLQEIQNVANKYKGKARSHTAKAVCSDFLFGDKSCQKVADDCNVTYHAVYDIIENLKNKIAYMMQHNQNCGYVATLDKKHVRTLKEKPRDYLNTYIYKVQCGSCGHKWVYQKKNMDPIKCSKCSSVVWDIEKEYVKLFS